MKKLHILAIAMLLSTGFITQAEDKDKKENKEQKNKDKKENKENKEQEKRATNRAANAAVIGTPPTNALIIAFVNNAITTFTAIATPTQTDAKNLREALKNANAALDQLYPKDKASA